jgi:tetratricopeptide (TPR) repeat protein
MRSSFGFMAIAISTIQIATIQTITVAKPVSNLSQIATEVSVHIVPKPGEREREYVGAIVKKDKDLYSVLLNISIEKMTKQIVTFDGRKYPIESIYNYDNKGRKYDGEVFMRHRMSSSEDRFTYSIVQFRSPINYRVVAIGDSTAIGKKGNIYVSVRRSRKILIQPNRVVLNNTGKIFYDNQEYNSPHEKEFIFNDRGELIGFHLQDKHSIDDEYFWPEYQGYPYPTLSSLFEIYHTSHWMSDVCGNYRRGIRARIVAMRDRYHVGETIEHLHLPAKKLGLRVNIQQNRQSQSIKSENDFAAALNTIDMSYRDDRDTIITALDRAIQSNPLNADLYGMRGNARIALSYRHENKDILNEQKMLADYDRAISLNPQDSISLFLRSNLKIDNEDYRGALADLDRLVALKPNSSAAYYYRSYLKQHHLKDFAGALTDYDRLVELNPKDPKVYLNRGLLQEQDIHNFQAALVDYNRVLEIQRTSTIDRTPDKDQILAVYYFIARLKAEKIQDFQGALADYNRIISSDSNNPKIYLERAEVKARLKDIDGALADYNFVLNRKDITPNLSDNAYVRRAKFKVNYLKDIAGALVDYNRAVEENSNNAETYYERGMFIDTYQQNRAAAKADFQKAIALLNSIEYKSETDLELLKKVKLVLGD